MARTATNVTAAAVSATVVARQTGLLDDDDLRGPGRVRRRGRARGAGSRHGAGRPCPRAPTRASPSRTAPPATSRPGPFPRVYWGANELRSPAARRHRISPDRKGIHVTLSHRRMRSARLVLTPRSRHRAARGRSRRAGHGHHEPGRASRSDHRDDRRPDLPRRARHAARLRRRGLHADPQRAVRLRQQPDPVLRRRRRAGQDRALDRVGADQLLRDLGRPAAAGHAARRRRRPTSSANATPAAAEHDHHEHGDHQPATRRHPAATSPVDHEPGDQDHERGVDRPKGSTTKTQRSAAKSTSVGSRRPSARRRAPDDEPVLARLDDVEQAEHRLVAGRASAARRRLRPRRAARRRRRPRRRRPGVARRPARPPLRPPVGATSPARRHGRAGDDRCSSTPSADRRRRSTSW